MNHRKAYDIKHYIPCCPNTAGIKFVMIDDVVKWESVGVAVRQRHPRHFAADIPNTGIFRE